MFWIDLYCLDILADVDCFLVSISLLEHVYYNQFQNGDYYVGKQGKVWSSIYEGFMTRVERKGMSSFEMSLIGCIRLDNNFP